jgi:desulfoferrodoxin (superoxide reductase-like protein)
MACIQKNPEYYEELSKMETKVDEQSDARQALTLEWEWKAAVSKLAVGPVFTASAPGSFSAAKHVPVLTISADRTAATVAVPHGMAADHWIQFIWARDDRTGRILGVAKLTAADKPEVTFDLPAGTQSITAFESCNL